MKWNKKNAGRSDWTGFQVDYSTHISARFNSFNAECSADDLMESIRYILKTDGKKEEREGMRPIPSSNSKEKKKGYKIRREALPSHIIFLPSRAQGGGDRGRGGHRRSNENYALVHIRKGFLYIYSSHKAFLLFIYFFLSFLQSISLSYCVLRN